MPLEAIKSVNEAEDTARKAKSEAAQAAKKRIEQARADGQAMVEAESAKAEDEVRHLMEAAGQKATENAKILSSQTNNRAATVTAHAETKMDEAVKLIVERIVNC